MEATAKRKAGRPAIKKEDDRAVTCSITMTVSQKNQLAIMATLANTTPSKLIIKRFKLK